MNHRKTLLVSLVAAVAATVGFGAMAQTAEGVRQAVEADLARHQGQVQQEERAAAARAERRAEAAEAADAQAAEGQPPAQAEEKEEAAEQN